jgi:hypothetical protein
MAKKKIICVTKIGRSPDLFCELPNNEDKYMALGDWETFKLLQLLSDKEPNSQIYYVGRCRSWNEDTVNNAFKNKNVEYIQSHGKDPYTKRYSLALDPRLETVNEFHYVLGPVTNANYGLDVALLNQDDPMKLRKIMCAFMNYVGPLYALMNCHPEALQFPYGTDNKYSHSAHDHTSAPGYTFSQCGKEFKTDVRVLANCNDPITKKLVDVTNMPFRFETLLLYGKDRDQYKYNFEDWQKRKSEVCVSMNQVSTNKSVKSTRIAQFEEKIAPRFSPDEAKILGKWTAPEVIEKYKDYFLDGNTDGFGKDYFDRVKEFRYSVMLFNYKIAGGKAHNVTDNWLTPKIWESLMLGNITFFEVINDDTAYISVLPKELMFSNADELREKIDKCESDPAYAKHLLELQWLHLKEEYFNGDYVYNFIENIRQERINGNPLFQSNGVYQKLEDIKNKNIRFQEIDLWPKE